MYSACLHDAEDFTIKQIIDSNHTMACLIK